MAEIKTSLEGFNNNLQQAEGRTGEPKGRATEITQSKDQQEKI